MASDVPHITALARASFHTLDAPSTCRAQHGWAESELYDDYGEPRERTDGGRVEKKKFKGRPGEEKQPITAHSR